MSCLDSLGFYFDQNHLKEYFVWLDQAKKISGYLIVDRNRNEHFKDLWKTDQILVYITLYTQATINNNNKQ